jgi:hypothetical protein
MAAWSVAAERGAPAAEQFAEFGWPAGIFGARIASMAQAVASPFHITVLTGYQGEPNLTNELRLVKAALLYGDGVNLVSPKLVCVPEDGSNRKLFWPRLVGTEALSEIAELARAVHVGALEIDDLGLYSDGFRSVGPPMLLRNDPEAAAHLADWLSTVVGPSAETYPMFDGQVADLFRDAAKDGFVAPRGAHAATEPSLAANFIGRMRTFPDAPIDEILDVRRELADPLVRFRSAVAALARQMEETPMDTAFGRTVDALYRETVAPALLEIDELERERRYSSQLGRQAKGGAGIPDIKETLTLAVTAYAMLPSLGYAAAGLVGTVASSVVNLATAAARERDRLAKDRKTNKFLFLSEAERRLGQ